MEEKLIKKLLGLRIKQLRKMANLTQFQLGEKIGIDQRQIAYIEGGNSFPSLKTLNKFTSIFNCSIKDLFDYEHLQEKIDINSEILKKISRMNDKQKKLSNQLLSVIINI